MKHLDLFSGIGGFALAARWAEIETIQFVEKDLFCQKVLGKNFPCVPIHDDIKTFKFNDKVDLITGGFPCQPFSIAGKKQGMKDDRYLWPDMFRIISECHPTWVLAENVPGIVPMLDPILEDLEGEGYAWQAYLIPASEFGAPHKRERLWIIAHCNRKRCNCRWNNWEKRYFQIDWERNLEKIHTEWTQFIPVSWKNFNAQEWLTSNSSSERFHEALYNKKQISRSTESKELQQTSLSDREIFNPDRNAICETNCKTFSSSKQEETWEDNSGKHRGEIPKFNWKEDQPPIPGVDDGLSNGLDRNKSLGNAVVPQIPYVFFEMMKEIESLLNPSS